MIDSVLRSFWRHPFRWLVGLALAVLSIFVICSGDGSNNLDNRPKQVQSADQVEPEVSAPPAIQAPEGAVNVPEKTKVYPGTEPDYIKADETEADIAAGRQIAASRRALPFLPLQTRNVRAEYKNQLPNGSLVVEITYRGTKTEAISVWRTFLNRYQDPGTAYLVIYRPV